MDVSLTSKIRDRRESLEGEKCQALWSFCRSSVTPTHVMRVITEAAALEQTDLEDFIAFVTRLQPILRQHAHRICGNWHTADDLVQETLIILHQRWNRITEDGRSAYARTVLAHLWANERRSARSHLESLPGVLPELPHEGEEEETARLDIRFAIAKLPPRTRHAILLRYWADVSTEEAAQILGIRPGYSPPPPPPLFEALAAIVPGVRNGYVEPSWGVEIAVELGDSYLGLDHALLAMIRNRETVPARALAGLADLDALDAAVVEAMNAPVAPGEDAVFLPEGQQLDSPLSRAIVDALPEGTTFGFNGADGRTWIQIYGPGGSLGPEVSREVLNTALVSLGRPGLGN